jgi:hypothetical protein
MIILSEQLRLKSMLRNFVFDIRILYNKQEKSLPEFDDRLAQPQTPRLIFSD